MIDRAKAATELTEGVPSQVGWLPTEASEARSRLRRFMEAHGFVSLDELHRRSIADQTWFWDAVVKDLDLEFYQPYQQVLDLSRGKPWARWFVGGKYNYVHNALDRHAAGPSAPKLAITWEGEDGAIRQLTYAELADMANRFASGLRQLGVEKGDRVGIFMPMIPEVAAATLAVGKLGAIYIPIFSGYAAPAVASRLADCGAKVLITADGFYRRGSRIPMGETALEAARQAPSVERVVVVCRFGDVSLPATEQVVYADKLVADVDTPPLTERTMADDPYMIIYTSGTTGRPKGAVHVHAGFPIKATQDLAHCFDLQADDTLFWLTDLGWMMGPWAIAGGLTLGASLCFYEGALDFPRPDRLWRIVERHRATLLGISPTAVRALMARGDEWVRSCDLSSLRAFGSTGEPWNPDPWWWLYQVAGGERCPILNYSGGTEISGGIVGGFTIAPSRPCAFAGPVPGIAADVVDERGEPVRGAVGELIIRQPWVGMTNGFWQDPQRYLDTYWSRWPDVWVHGDWARVDDDGSWFILGRSDDTIKLAGKRVGPAEVESAAVAHPAVAEAAAIGVPDEVKGEALVVLVVLRTGHRAGGPLREAIRAVVAEQLGRALRPEEVRFVAELPRTRNAKILRRVVKGAYLGRDDLGDLSALENPSAIDAIRHAT
jgi:acetyl-CoA synthetase